MKTSNSTIKILNSFKSDSRNIVKAFQVLGFEKA